MNLLNHLLYDIKGLYLVAIFHYLSKVANPTYPTGSSEIVSYLISNKPTFNLLSRVCLLVFMLNV